MADKPLFDIGFGRQTKQVLVIAGITLAVLAVYEFSSNAGTTAGAEIGSGVGSAAKTVGYGAAAALLLLVLL